MLHIRSEQISLSDLTEVLFNNTGISSEYTASKGTKDEGPVHVMKAFGGWKG